MTSTSHDDFDAVAFVRALSSFSKAPSSEALALPVPFKQYRGLRRVQMAPVGVGRRLGPTMVPGSKASLDDSRLATLLALTGGVHRYTAIPTAGGRLARYIRRPIPSGGAFYPNEIYVYVRDASVAAPGLYHYDAADHSLVELRRDDLDSALTEALGAAPTAAVLLFLSALLWKNYVKYDEFGYRLLAQDTGVLLGQVLTVAGHVFEKAAARFYFGDVALSRLLGLDLDEEAVYAVVDLGHHGSAEGQARPFDRAPSPSGAPPAALTPTFSGRRSERVAAMHRSCFREAPRAPCPYLPPLTLPPALGSELPLPQPVWGGRDLVTSIRNRTSGGPRFRPAPISRGTLSALLAYAARSYVSDVQSPSRWLRRPLLGVVVRNVHELPPGAYFYDPEPCALRVAQLGDFGEELRHALRVAVPNMRVPAVTVHLFGARGFHHEVAGARGYRIQQMEVGLVGQRLQLAASALDLSANLILGYDGERIERIYHQDQGDLTVVLQIAVGAASQRLSLEGDLHAW